MEKEQKPNYSSRVKDLVGQKFGRLTVLEFAGINKRIAGTKSHSSSMWKVQCDCGTIYIVKSNVKNIKSCGCLNKEVLQKRALPKGESSFNCLYNKYKREAIQRGYEFNLNKSIFKLLTSSNCYYCNTNPKQSLNYKTCNGEYIYNGIDRKDNNIGYTINNVVSCCGECNLMKGRLNNKQFLEKIKTILKYQEEQRLRY